MWYLEDYVNEMEGENSEKDPMTMEECASLAETSLTSQLKAEAICIGNIDEKGTKEVIDVINRVFLDKARTLNHNEIPSFKSMKLPTAHEAQSIFGSEIANESIPIKYQELAQSPSEENNAAEITLQLGSDFSLGYEGIGLLDRCTVPWPQPAFWWHLGDKLHTHRVLFLSSLSSFQPSSQKLALQAADPFPRLRASVQFLSHRQMFRTLIDSFSDPLRSVPSEYQSHHPPTRQL